MKSKSKYPEVSTTTKIKPSFKMQKKTITLWKETIKNTRTHTAQKSYSAVGLAAGRRFGTRNAGRVNPSLCSYCVSIHSLVANLRPLLFFFRREHTHTYQAPGSAGNGGVGRLFSISRRIHLVGEGVYMACGKGKYFPKAIPFFLSGLD